MSDFSRKALLRIDDVRTGLLSQGQTIKIQTQSVSQSLDFEIGSQLIRVDGVCAQYEGQCYFLCAHPSEMINFDGTTSVAILPVDRADMSTLTPWQTAQLDTVGQGQLEFL
ncbi:hypothetical protein [Ponticaulis profundi]|uniref:Uncharacterized protein n=1 Tax=Ponticaulis profundi TaxID=2665222 RepID=A0ABW1S6F7_9PROT